MKNFTLAAIGILATSIALAAGPGGGTPPGGGNQPGGNQPSGPGGSSATFTFDTFLEAATTNSNGTITRAGVWTGYTSAIASPSVASSVSRLAPGVCSGCTTLTSVDLSACASLTEIPDSAFADCTSLTTVTLPSSCTTIGPNAFAGCTSLTTFSGSGVTTVNHDAFRNCSALTSPKLPATVGSYAYSQSGVTSADLSGVTTLGEGVFAGCESLTAATVATDATLPAATFAGCTALDVSDWSGVSAFGQAALAGIPATTLTFSSSATLGAYACAADSATVVTTLDQSALPASDATAFLGREVSYTPVAGSVARIEAMDLIKWLSDATASVGVTQPADYNTATLKTWLADSANAYAYAYADDLAADDDFIGLMVSGTGFVYNEPSDAALAITVTPVACYTLSSDESDWSVDNLAWSDSDNAYLAKDATQTSCFARLRFSWDW